MGAEPRKMLRSKLNGVVYSWNVNMAKMDHMEEFIPHPDVAFSSSNAAVPESDDDAPDVPVVDLDDLTE